ncbi:MAG: galactosyltransferase-related protein [Bacteroidales bacterium]|nr:galactosyltransferase-related protein [Bacteroidales bacterium]
METSSDILSILILYRGDSIRRLYNLKAVVASLLPFDGIEIHVREADRVNHHVVERMLQYVANYEFVEDTDSILHKTLHFNQMLTCITTPYVGIWDCDVIAYPESVEECMRELTTGNAAMALPYNGVCLDTSRVIADIYMRDYDFMTLKNHSQLMPKLQPHRLTGGAVLMNRETFRLLGDENENYYGWGDDDFDRYIRFYNAQEKIFRSNTPLFHLTHPRGENSNFNSPLLALASKTELSKTINCKR